MTREEGLRDLTHALSGFLIYTDKYGGIDPRHYTEAWAAIGRMMPVITPEPVGVSEVVEAKPELIPGELKGIGEPEYVPSFEELAERSKQFFSPGIREIQIEGKLAELEIKQDYSVWLNGERVGDVVGDPYTGFLEIKPIEGVPVEPTKMERLVEKATEISYPSLEKQLEAIQMPFKFSGQVLATPFIATEELGTSTPEELFKTGQIQKKYEKLPLWQQLLAELPSYAAIPIGGLSATSARAALSASPKVYLRWLAKVLTPVAKTEEYVAKAISYVPEKISQKLTERQLLKVFEKLPTDEELASVLTKDWYRDAANALSKIPGMKAVIKRINPSGVVESDTEKAILRHLALLETTENKGNAILALLERYGNDVGLFGVKEGGLCTKVKIKPEFEGKVPLTKGQPALGDVLEYPTYFALTKNQATYINTLWKLEDAVRNMLIKEGISINELAFREGTHWVHRVVRGRAGEKGIELARTGSTRIGAKKPFEKTRYYEFMQEGIERGVVYGQSPNQYYRTYYDGAMKLIADKRLASAIPGQTTLERMSMELRKEAVDNALRVRNYTRLADRLRKVKANWEAPPITLKAIDRWDTQIGRELRAILRGDIKPRPAIIKKPPELPEGYTRSELMELEAEIAGLREWIAFEPAAKLKDLVKRVGWYKGEISNLTVRQYKLLKGGRTPPKSILTEDGKHVRWEYALDDVATEMGYASGEELKYAVEHVIEATARLRLLEAELTRATGRTLPEVVTQKVPIPTRKEALSSLIKVAETKLDVARQVHRVSRIAYKKAKEIASRPHLGTEAYISQPAFTGKIYSKETADTINKFFGDRASGWLQAMNNLSSASRTAVATFDFSAPFIQGLPVFGRSPLIWANAVLRQFLTFFTPGMYYRFMAKEGATLQEMATHRCLVFGGGMHEYVEAIPMLARALKRIPLLGKPLRAVFEETYGRFGVSFSSFGDYSRVMLWKSMQKGWAKRGQLDELGRIINHMTGAISTRALGVTSSQRAFESGFVFFAPRYTRAGLALFADILKGGWTSIEALRAIGGFMASGSAIYVGTCAALGQTPNFDPSTGRFMTVKVGNQYIGIGGFINSMVRFAADVYASVASEGENEPIDFISLDRYKNPIIRLLFSKAAPMTSLISGLATQKDYLGRKLETSEDWARYLLDFMIPIAMQTITTQEEKANREAFIVEMLGGRTFPESVWDGVKDIRDRWAKIDYGKAYEDLDIHDKRMLEKNHPEIRQFVQEANAKWAKWYPDEPRVKYNAEMDANDKDYSDRMWAAYREVETGLGLMSDYPDKVSGFSGDHALLAGDIRDRYPEVIAEFERWREQDKQDWLLFDQAYDEYINTVVAPTWEDEFYNFNYEGYRVAQDSFKTKWGDMIYDEVRETLWLDDDIPPLYLELKAAREAWGKYYELEEGKPRDAFRRENPKVDAFLMFFGRITTTKSSGATILVEALMEKYDIPDESLPALKKHKLKVERELGKPLANLMQEDPTLAKAIQTGNFTAEQRRRLVTLYTKLYRQPGVGGAFEEWLITDLRAILK